MDEKGDYLLSEVGHSEGGDRPNKTFFDPRGWVAAPIGPGLALVSRHAAMTGVDCRALAQAIESDQLDGGFARRRGALLEVLASQAATSLENARRQAELLAKCGSDAREVGLPGAWLPRAVAAR